MTLINDIISSLQELKNAEISQCTQEVPVGLQHENTAPDKLVEYTM